jgi:hypothetical protein
MKSSKKLSACFLATMGLTAIMTGCSTGSNTAQSLPAYDSLDETYEAVDAVLDCVDNPPQAPHKVPQSGGPTGTSEMCTNTVEVLWFDSDEAYKNVYDLYASAAAPGGSVYFATGQNWFVVDDSEVAVGTTPESRDLETLAKKLGAEYKVEK